MPTLKDSLNYNIDGYTEIEKTVNHVAVNVQQSFNRMMRCPLPPVSVSPDSLRQFYIDGQVPQVRLIPPKV